MKQQRLELTWIGKDERPRLEPRILVEDRGKGHRAAMRRNGEQLDNLLVQGDNLLALKALEANYAGKIKCVFMDPPYNTGSAFEQYDDGIEHSLWLTMMRDRVEAIYGLITDDRSLWVTLDDNEAHYFKVMCDELFGRNNFVASCIWQKRYSRENRGAIGDAHDYVLVYAKNASLFKDISSRIPLDEKSAAIYKNNNNDPRGRWRGIPMTAQGYRPNQMYEITTPTGDRHRPPEGRCWGMVEPRFKKLVAEGRIYFGKDGSSQPSVIRYLSEVEGLTPWTWWPHDEVGHNDEAKKESHSLFGRDMAFATPKPERLIKRILDIATSPGDIVLDSFAGSGTTGAVAHKMGRRWVMVELHNQASTHIVPRLTKVIDGQDPAGVTEATGWQGGGGFRFFKLAPSLLRQDRYGQWVISSEYQPEMLAEAVCKLLGFIFAPSRDAATYWRHGHSTETDFIFVTTQAMTFEALTKLSDEVGEGRTLLIACRAYMARADAFPNLTMKKIPHAVLTQCEWDRDDYSLAVQGSPKDEEDRRDGEADASDAEALPLKAKRGRPRAVPSESPSLFGEEL